LIPERTKRVAEKASDALIAVKDKESFKTETFIATREHVMALAY